MNDLPAASPLAAQQALVTPPQQARAVAHSITPQRTTAPSAAASVARGGDFSAHQGETSRLFGSPVAPATMGRQGILPGAGAPRAGYPVEADASAAWEDSFSDNNNKFLYKWVQRVGESGQQFPIGVVTDRRVRVLPLFQREEGCEEGDPR
eukprot:1178480-Prorocentrum_minimum.AAC.3